MGPAGAAPILLLLAVAISASNAEFDMQFTKSPESITVPLGDEVVFDCAVNVPADRLVWKFKAFDGVWTDLLQSDEIRISPPRQNSTRVSVLLKDERLTGDYMCVVWYGAIALASVPGRLTLAQLIVPKTVKERHINAPTNNFIALHCPKPLSSPPAIITFWKKGPGGIRLNVSTNGGVLVIRNSKKSDSGVYGCSATNELSSIVKDIPEIIHLTVQDEIGIRSPSFLEPLDLVGDVSTSADLPEVRSVPGGSIHLICGLVGYPIPRITWKKADGPLPNRAKIDMTTSQILTLNNIRGEDEGIYSCETSGGISRSWRVRGGRAARWRGAAKVSDATEGHHAHAHCARPEGKPQPEITWMLNAQPLVNDGNIRVQEEDLYIEHVEKKHAGIIQCFVSNEFGSDYLAVLLQVVPQQITSQEYDNISAKGLKFISNNAGRGGRHRKKPKQKQEIMVPPSRPNVTRLSDESLMVTWRQPVTYNALNVQIYKVQYKDVTLADIHWKTANEDIPSHITSYAVDGLEPGHEYKFRIAAVYSNQDNKAGKVSAPFLLQRGGGGLREPPVPTFTNASPLSPTQLIINWTLADTDLPVGGFYIYYRETVSAGKYYKMVVQSPAARSAVISHLNSDNHYEIKIQSFTSIAPSPFSVIKTTHTLKLSTEPPPSTTPIPSAPPAGSPPSVYTAAVVAGGVAAVLVCLLLILIACRRKRGAPNEEKPTVEERPVTNGYIGSKLPITITANPLHAEASDIPVEMSYLHNNNCNSNADERQAESPPPRIIKTYNSLHSHSNGVPRSYV